MAAYTYPTSEELRRIESEKVEALMMDSPVFKIFPITQARDWRLRWSVDGYIGGLAQLRGLDVASQHVERVGYSDYEMAPGVYGEHMMIKETELAMRAQRFYPGGGEGRVDVTELILNMQDQLIDRRLRLIKYIAWTLLCTGTFAIADKKGAGGYRHTDTYSLGTYDATTWATVATATPLADFRAVGLLARGKNANFGAGAMAFANLNTIYNLLGNTNAADLGGRYIGNLNRALSVQDIQGILIGANMPNLVPIEEGYYDSSGTFQLFVPNGKVVVVSAPTGIGDTIGEYRMVWQVVTNASGAPSPYQIIRDSTKNPLGPTVPPLIVVEDGHNGGPVVTRPWKVVVMDVS